MLIKFLNSKNLFFSRFPFRAQSFLAQFLFPPLASLFFPTQSTSAPSFPHFLAHLRFALARFLFFLFPARPSLLHPGFSSFHATAQQSTMPLCTTATDRWSLHVSVLIFVFYLVFESVYCTPAPPSSFLTLPPQAFKSLRIGVKILALLSSLQNPNSPLKLRHLLAESKPRSHPAGALSHRIVSPPVRGCPLRCYKRDHLLMFYMVRTSSSLGTHCFVTSAAALSLAAATVVVSRENRPRHHIHRASFALIRNLTVTSMPPFARTLIPEHRRRHRADMATTPTPLSCHLASTSAAMSALRRVSILVSSPRISPKL